MSKRKKKKKISSKEYERRKRQKDESSFLLDKDGNFIKATLTKINGVRGYRLEKKEEEL